MAQPQKDLYIDLMYGFKEVAEDARAEEELLNLIDRYLVDPIAFGEADKANMERKIFDGIAYVWDRMTVTACCHNTVPFKKMQRLLRETYKALTLFHKGNYAPKGITNILLYMDHFLSRVAQAPGPKEGCIFGILFDHYMIFSDMIAALKEGFLSGRYETAYPVLRVRDCHKNTYLFDVENDNLKELMGEGA
jgi:hypothetical protein